MSDQKKDLTNLMDYSEALRKSGQAPPVPEGSVMEEQKIEAIDNFETLDDYAKSNPAAEPPPEPAFDPPPPAPAVAEAPPVTSGGFTDSAFPVIADAEPLPEAPSESPPFELPQDFASATEPMPSEPAPPEPPPEPLAEMALSPPEPILPPPPAPRRAEPAPLPQKSAPTPMEQVKIYSEQASMARAAVPAAFPFSLRIRGQLTAHEKEKLLDLLSRENMGFREMDLEPQLEAGQILIPRISEYAGVLLVQTLRGARAKILLGPADEIFATEDTRGDEDTMSAIEEEQAQVMTSEPHLAEHMPVTTEPALPGGVSYQVIDAISASTTLKSQVVEAERSSEYQDIIEALQRELKYKAYRRGANAIVNFSVQLTALSLPTHYRVMVLGSAVRTKSAQQPS